MKILAVCAHGLGSSFLMEMNIKKALVKLGPSPASGDADLFVMGADIVDSSSIERSKIIIINNLVSADEFEHKLAVYFHRD